MARRVDPQTLRDMSPSRHGARGAGWTVRDTSGQTWGPFSPSRLQRHVIERRIHPDWYASDGFTQHTVRDVIWQAVREVRAQPPASQAGDGRVWTVQDPNGRNWGPYSPGWLLRYLIEGRIRSDWQASDGVRSCAVLEALGHPEQSPQQQGIPHDISCPNCGGLIRAGSARCPYCRTDVRSFWQPEQTEQHSPPQFAHVPCPGDCGGTILVPIEKATRQVSCLDCGASYDCLIGKVRTKGGYVIWEKHHNDDGSYSSAPTSTKKWQIRYDEINTGDGEALLDCVVGFQGHDRYCSQARRHLHLSAASHLTPHPQLFEREPGKRLESCRRGWVPAQRARHRHCHRFACAALSTRAHPTRQRLIEKTIVYSLAVRITRPRRQV